MVWGWLISSTFTFVVSLSLAEICGAFPTSGSVYHWAQELSPPEWSPFLSYWTGLSSWLGNASGNSTTALYVTTTLSSILTASGYPPLSVIAQVLFSIFMITVWSVSNFFGVEKIGWISNLSALILVLCTFVISGTVLVMAPSLQPTSFVFFDYENDTGFSSPSYVCLISLLVPLFSFCGYEASSLVAEETKNASIAAPFGIISSVIASAIGGFVFLVPLLYAIQDIKPIADFDNDASILTLFQQSTTMPVAVFLLTLLMLNTFLNGIANTTLAARITYALGRDGMLPFSSFVTVLDSYNKSPINAIMYVYVFNFFLLLLPLTASGSAAFSSVASVCTIGYQISYAIPIICKFTFTQSDELFSKVYINLGSYSNLCGWISAVWLLVSSFVILLPTESPITFASMNYSVCVAFVFVLFGTLYWIFNKFSPTRPQFSPVSKFASTPFANNVSNNYREVELLSCEQDTATRYSI
jgi:amino acid transporter